jgi:hypothetical protein
LSGPAAGIIGTVVNRKRIKGAVPGDIVKAEPATLVAAAAIKKSRDVIICCARVVQRSLQVSPVFSFSMKEKEKSKAAKSSKRCSLFI